MNPGDEVLYPNPGYPDLRVADRVPRRRRGALRLPRRRRTALSSTSRPSRPPSRRARGCSILNDLQNPLGAECSPAELERLAELVLQPRPAGALRRGLLRHPLRGPEPSLASLPGHGRAQRDPLHVLQEVRHDRLAPGRGHRAARGHRRDRQAQRQRRVLPQPLHPVRRPRGSHRRPERAPRTSSRSCASAATRPSSC